MLVLDLDGSGSFLAGDIDVAAGGIGRGGGVAVDLDGTQGCLVGGTEPEQDLSGRLNRVERNGRLGGVCVGIRFVGDADVAERRRDVVGLERFGLCKPCPGDGPAEVQRAVMRVDEHVPQPGDGVGFVAGLDEYVV